MADPILNSMPLLERLRRRRPLVMVVVGLITFVSTAGVAVALWSATGSGNGGAKALTAQALTITAAGAPTADLFPGASGDLQFTVTNPNPYPISLTDVDYGAVTSSDQANCPAANLTTAADGSLAAPIALNANAVNTPATIADAITLDVNAPDGCQGVTFTVAITLTGTQV